MRVTYCNVDCYSKIFVVIVRRGSVRANTTRLGTRSRQPVLKLFKNCSNTCDYFSTGQACDVDPAGELREPDVLEYDSIEGDYQTSRGLLRKTNLPTPSYQIRAVWRLVLIFGKVYSCHGYNYFKPCERDGFEYSILALRETWTSS